MFIIDFNDFVINKMNKNNFRLVRICNYSYLSDGIVLHIIHVLQ